MEQVLDIYERAYNADYPVICMDERPCQLIGEVLVPLPMKPGQSLRQDYHYERHGTCVVLMAIEPLAGYRLVDVLHLIEKLADTDSIRPAKPGGSGQSGFHKQIVIRRMLLVKCN